MIRRITMKPVSIGFILLAVGVLGGPVQVAVLGAEARSSGLPKWEYRVLTKDEVLKLGQKDLTAGLNKLGDAGWELVTVESDAQEPGSRAAQKSAQFYFKRPANLIEKQAETVKERIRRAEFTVTSWMEEVARAERLLTRGFISKKDLQAVKDQLKEAETALDEARTELKKLAPDSKESAHKQRELKK
jgi:hypothetical protein